MSLKSLEAFSAIIKTGSATAAAKHLGLTQPGISRLLALLEEYIGFQLFYREKGRLIPTDEALTLIKEVDLTLMSVDRISLLANNIFNSNLGQLRLVAPNSFIAGPLANVVTDFLKKHPKVKISLDTHSPTRAREIVAHRSADCGFIQLPENHPGLICQHIVSSNTVCAVSSEHKLAKCKRLTCKDLAGEDLILLGKGRNSRLQIENVFLREKIPLQVRLETHTVAIACTFAKKNVGIAIVNEMLAKQYANEGLVLIAFSPKIVHEYAFITSAHAPMNRLTESFYQHCKTYFANMDMAQNED
ncbi:LysR family transcriptional regulator [Paraglaciecola sp.]|uniref:LysR family transcriptional regulator n=1 Tax=Paraglaciecola sp. TaxID=1920173 RepID=UPI0030F3D869